MTALLCVMLNTRQRVEELGVACTTVCLLTTIKWLHRGAPFTFQWKSERVQEELEFKKSWNMIYWGAACSFTRQRAEGPGDFIEAHCGVPSSERHYQIVMYLYVCVSDIWYLRVRVSLRMWQGMLRVSTLMIIEIVLLIRACRPPPSRPCAYQPQWSL